MFRKFLIYSFCCLTLIQFASCGNDKQAKREAPNEKTLREPLIKANKHLAQSEADLIADFINRYGWEMQTTGNGLRYMIYKNGDGPAVKEGDMVVLDYDLRLINGVVVYNSVNDGSLKFKQGNAEVCKGLDEAVLMLHQGDQAKLIIPSHLGYGLIGDQDRIPARATLIYDIHVIRPEN